MKYPWVFWWSQYHTSLISVVEDHCTCIIIPSAIVWHAAHTHCAKTWPPYAAPRPPGDHAEDLLIYVSGPMTSRAMSSEIDLRFVAIAAKTREFKGQNQSAIYVLCHINKCSNTFGNKSRWVLLTLSMRSYGTERICASASRNTSIERLNNSSCSTRLRCHGDQQSLLFRWRNDELCWCNSHVSDSSNWCRRSSWCENVKLWKKIKVESLNLTELRYIRPPQHGEKVTRLNF